MKKDTIAVRLTPELKQFVEGKVRGGRYRDTSEVVREALRLMEEGRPGVEEPSLEALIQEGLDSGPAEVLTPQTWKSIWADSEKMARAFRRQRKRAA